MRGVIDSEVVGKGCLRVDDAGLSSPVDVFSVNGAFGVRQVKNCDFETVTILGKIDISAFDVESRVEGF